jgi:hypothetical protein
MAEISCLFHGIFQHFFGARRLRKATHRNGIGTASDDFFDFVANFAEVNVKVFQNICGDSASLLDKSKQEMFRSDVFVIEPLGFLVGKLHYLPRPVGKSFVWHYFLMVEDILSISEPTTVYYTSNSVICNTEIANISIAVS